MPKAYYLPLCKAKIFKKKQSTINNLIEIRSRLMGYTKEYEVAKGDRSFPARLKTLLNAEHMTQKDLAAYCGVSPASITGWMGGSEPDFDTLRRLAGKFNVTIDYLLGASDNKSKEESIQEVGRLIGLDDDAIRVLADRNLNRAFYKSLVEVDLGYSSPLCDPTVLLSRLFQDGKFIGYLTCFLAAKRDKANGWGHSDIEAKAYLIDIQSLLLSIREEIQDRIDCSREPLEKKITKYDPKYNN